MIFKQKTHRQRRAAATPEPTLSPRLAALVRESWWLLVVAIFAYLALILATYQRSDPGWSFSGSGTAIHNKGGAVGAWLADLLLYLFGVSAWWWVFAGIIRGSPCPGSRWSCCPAQHSRRCACIACPRRCRTRPAAHWAR